MGRKPTVNLNLPPRLRARTQKSGKVYYYYDTGEKPRREIPLGDDYAMAVKKWAEMEIDARPRHTALITFRYAAERYQREVLPTKAPRTQKDNLKELAKLYEFFDNPPAPLAEIKPVHIRQYLDWRRDAQVRANREKALFSHIWNKAREWGLTDQPNPCLGVKGFKESGRDTYVDDAIYRAVYDEADQPTRDALDLAYLTGQRPADTLKFQETDLKDSTLVLQQNKTGKKLRIALKHDDGQPNELAKLIERMQERKRRHTVRSLALVCNEKGQPLTQSALRGRFDRARETAMEKHPRLAGEIKQFQFRDLRAKAGTDKEQREGILAAQDQLGHEDAAMTKHYVRHRLGKLVKPTR